jgi:peptidoglycan hydrolase-like protein with peptidoglycan-binding domain
VINRSIIAKCSFLPLVVAAFLLPQPTQASTFTHALIQGQNGTDISALQQILIQQGFLDAGSNTGYVGPLTAKAVAAFQTAHGIDPLGGVGPLTRTLLNSLLGSSTIAVPIITAQTQTSTAQSATGVVFTHALIQGDSGADITALQRILIGQGFLSSDSDTGYFGPATAKAVAAFQTMHGIDPLGGVGPLTRTLLNSFATGTAASTTQVAPTVATSQTSTQTVAAQTSCMQVTLTRPMDPGISGSDVSQLQQFLVAQKYLHTAPTGYFGALTTAAVKAFQKDNGIEMLGGGVGPLTRAKIAALSSTCTQPNVTITQTSGSASTTPIKITVTATTTPPSIIGGGGGGSGGGGGGGGGSTPPADTNAPTVPTALLASVASANQINLSWSPATDNTAVTGYKVFRDGTQVGTTASTNFADSGLSPSTLHSYWVAAYDAAGNTSTTSPAVSAVTNFGADAYGTTWKPLRIGAGGFITGIDIAADGTKVIRTDTYGAYLWDGTQWDQLISNSSMAASGIQKDVYAGGVYEIAIAPSNTNRFYIEFGGYVYRSDNRGATWIKTNFAKATADGANDMYRTYGRKIAIDPANADVALVGTPSDGVWMTTDAGATWSHITALGTSTVDINGVSPGHTIGYDFSSSVVGGQTQGIYASTYGTGVYHSTDGGATWTLTTGTPTTTQHMVVAHDGTVYLVANEIGNNLHIYSGGSWTSVSVGANGNSLHAVAVDPNNPDHIVVAHDGGDLSISTDHAATFTGYSNNVSQVSTDIPWLTFSGGYMSSGDLAFDPTASNVLYQSVGDGVVYTTPTVPNTHVTFTWQSKGIEQLVANYIVSPPGGDPLVVSWDRAVFDVDNPDVFPSGYGPANSFAAGWDVDYAKNNSNYVAGVLGSGNNQASGYSTDGGKTWQTFASMPSGLFSLSGGSLAVASSSNLVVFPSDNGQPYYTKDGGNTWTQISITGLPSSGESGWSWAYYLNRHIVTADPINLGTFYAYNYGPTGYNPSGSGVYKSTDGGTTWSHIYTGEITLFSGFNTTMKAVPNKSGDLFFTGGFQSGDTLSTPVDEPFKHSTDGGVTWDSVPNVLEVGAFGFGKAATGTTTPTLYIVGWVNNVYGIFESDDDAATWT